MSQPGLAVSLYVKGRRCIVVGTGPMVDERAARLAAAEADVVRLPAADVTPDAFAGAYLVMCCDADAAEGARSAAKRQGALYYALDRPDLSDLAMPALARRGPLTLAIATDGVAPALARRFREELERVLTGAGAAIDSLLDELGARRQALPPGQRRDVLYAEAARLRFDGQLVVDPPGPPGPPPASSKS